MQKHVINTGLMVILFTFILILAGSGQLLAATFTADVVEIHKGKAKTYKIYVLDHKYRLDVEEGGRALNILVDRKSGKTRLIVPSEEVYLEIDNDDMQSLSNNPFEAQRYMAKKYASRSVGKEPLNGLACDKQIISTQGKDVMTAWIASKYNFPIKIESGMGARTLRLENLRDGGVKASIFEVPSGYRLVKSMPIAPPDWADEIAAAPLVAPPFEKSLQEGQIIRIKPVCDFNVNLKVKTPPGIKGSFTSNAFKDGRPLHIVTGYPGGTRLVHKESPDEADEIVVRTKSGQIIVKAVLLEAPEGLVLTKHYLKGMSGRELHPDQNKAFRLQLTDRADDGRNSRGTLTLYQGRAQHKKLFKKEEVTLDSGQSKTWRYDAGQQIDTIDLIILSGGVDVRLEQPEKAGGIPPSWTRAAEAQTPAAAPSKAASTPSAAPPRQKSPAAKTTPVKDSKTSCMVLVLDASGSMWGQIDGKAKIAIAKQVMAELVAELPEDVNVGLTVYGHRRKADCRDIEMIMPVQRLNAGALTSKIQAIQPKGKTPIGATLLQIAETLKNQPGEKVIVLVTDGLESCDQDPCKVARQLKAAGVITRIHIVGFDLKGDALAKLKCITDPSGGLLVGANNAAELKSALSEVVAATLPNNLLVTGVDANDKGLYITVQVSQGQKPIIKRSGHNLRFSLPEGTYSLDVRYAAIDQSVSLDNVRVFNDRLTQKKVVFAQSKLKIKSLDANNKLLYSSAVVFEAGTDKLVKKGSGRGHSFTLVPGVYDIKVTYGATKAEQWIRNLEAKAGAQIVKEVVFAEARLKIRAFECKKKTVYTKAEVYRGGTSELVHRTSGNAPSFVLLPGVYDVKVICGVIKEHKWLRDVQLKAGDRIEKQVSFAFGKFKVTGRSTDGKKPYLGVTVYRAGSGEKIHRSTGNSPSFVLKPGAYDIHIVAKSLNAEKWQRGVVIEDGADIKQQIQF